MGQNYKTSATRASKSQKNALRELCAIRPLRGRHRHCRVARPNRVAVCSTCLSRFHAAGIGRGERPMRFWCVCDGRQGARFETVGATPPGVTSPAREPGRLLNCSASLRVTFHVKSKRSRYVRRLDVAMGVLRCDLRGSPSSGARGAMVARRISSGRCGFESRLSHSDESRYTLRPSPSAGAGRVLRAASRGCCRGARMPCGAA